MPDTAPNPELLRSLGDLVRGLSVLFWGLPLALVVCVQTSQADYLRLFNIWPPVLTMAVLVYGLSLLARFRKEEAVWIAALERARFVAVINLGLSPFLFWGSRVPSSLFFTLMSEIMALTGLVFLLLLSPVLRRLTAMLPDEALRTDTTVFTRMTTRLLALNLALVTAQSVLRHLKHPLVLPHLRPQWLDALWQEGWHWGGWFLVLLTVALTMALLWKTKEVIFHSVFGGPR